MNISTKFFTSSATFIGLITAIIIGNTFVVQQTRQTIHNKSKQATETIKIALEAENALESEIILLKDIVLFNSQDVEINSNETEFIQSLDKLDKLMDNDTKIVLIRRRHQFLSKLATELINRKPSQLDIAASQKYFLVINSYNRDIDFFLKDLIDRAYQENQIIESDLKKLQHLQEIISFIVIALIIILLICNFLILWRPVIKSLQKLQNGTTEIAAGNFDYRLDIWTGDELEDLAQGFNHMGWKLAESRETLLKNTELTQMNQQLELEIAERKQAELELQKTLQELQQTQAQLIQTEKMSSLGQLVAGIAHEINNPVNFIYGNITHASQYTQQLLELISCYQAEFPEPGDKIQETVDDIDWEFVQDDLPKVMNSIKLGSNRIRDIVLSLRNFSRLDEADMKEVDIHEGIESTLMILQNRLKVKPGHPKIEVIKEYGQLPLIQCYAGQLNQVFLNILNNAIDAIDIYNKQSYQPEIQSRSSQIKITTTRDNNQAFIQIGDNGIGMTSEVKKKLFDPFFTTKSIGEGSGLGLSISYQIIVERHSGMIWCISEVNQGAEFWIQIPLIQQKKQLEAKVEIVETNSSVQIPCKF